MTGKAKEYFDLREADRDTTDAAKSYDELLVKLEDYSRRRALDSSEKEKMQHGGDPMDGGVVGNLGWWGSAEDTTMKGCMPSLSHAQVKARAKAKEMFTSAARRAISRARAHTSKRARAKAKYSKDDVTTSEKQVIPCESARKANKEETQRARR